MPKQADKPKVDAELTKRLLADKNMMETAKAALKKKKVKK